MPPPDTPAETNAKARALLEANDPLSLADEFARKHAIFFALRSKLQREADGAALNRTAGSVLLQ